jgi:hypothetical protein
MIQTLSKYSFTVLLTMLVALNADIPLRGSLDSFNPVEREAPVRINLQDENRLSQTASQDCTRKKPGASLKVYHLPIENTTRYTAARHNRPLFILNRTLLI